MTKDIHSFGNPEQVRVRHVHLSLDVDFTAKQLRGYADLTVERTANDSSPPLILDTRNLAIQKVEAAADGTHFTETKHQLGPADAILGTPLSIALPSGAKQVRVHYATSPQASGLQWLAPEKTAGKHQPFLFTQSQAIHARSWIPLQDSPGVRITYSAQVRTPANLVAVMSAAHDGQRAHQGTYDFRMPQPIPSYLLALAVGDLAFQPLSARAGVYAEPSMLGRAAAEFADLEAMIQATESLYGPYRWERYDVLVLPPSFPFGGMENPRLTFATPTILAGDKSLVSLIAHELAHSWSGNLVTNATWSDFWLNEGFTVYLERRILEKVYGQRRADMEAVLGRQDLEKEMAELAPNDQVLHIDLRGRDPDDAVTSVPYEKGVLFLRHLEQAVGRERFDAFVKGYFEHFAFQSITTADFLAYLKQHLLAQAPAVADQVPLDQWIFQPGIPASAPRLEAEALRAVSEQAQQWLSGKAALAAMPAPKWSTQEWLHFLRALPTQLGAEKMAQLDQAFELTHKGNAEIEHQWLLMAIRNDYAPAFSRLEEYLINIGRRKLVKPLFEELVKTPKGKERALVIYRKARPGYHPITIGTLDPIVGWKEGS